MNTDDKPKLPKTSCLKMDSCAVACDKYIREGTYAKDFHCCQTCSWNPEVTERRIERIREQLTRPKKMRIGGAA